MDACGDGANAQIEIAPGSGVELNAPFDCTADPTLCQATAEFTLSFNTDDESGENFLFQINTDCGMECDSFFVSGGYEVVIIP